MGFTSHPLVVLLRYLCFERLVPHNIWRCIWYNLLGLLLCQSFIQPLADVSSRKDNERFKFRPICLCCQADRHFRLLVARCFHVYRVLANRINSSIGKHVLPNSGFIHSYNVAVSVRKRFAQTSQCKT